MIDFRYHIVSIIAVFLALGVGILLGVAVLNTGTVSVLDRQVRALRRGLDEARAQILAVRKERDQARQLGQQVSPYVTQGRLSGQKVLFFDDGQSPRWRDNVRDGLLAAGAQSVGVIAMTERWREFGQDEGAQLTATVREVFPDFQPGPRPAETALALLGRRLFEEDGGQLLRRLQETKFLDVDDGGAGPAWPPRGALVVALAGNYPKNVTVPAWSSSFMRAVAAVTGTLAVAGAPDDYGAVDVLRQTDGLPAGLSTFDAGGSEAARIGTTLALEAAVKGRGGHYGTENGRRFVPEAA